MLVVAAAALLWRPWFSGGPGDVARNSGRLWLGLMMAINAVLVLGGLRAVTLPAAIESVLFGMYVLSPMLLQRAVTRLTAPEAVRAMDGLLLVPVVVLTVLAANGLWWWAMVLLHVLAAVFLGMSAGALRRAPTWLRTLFAVFLLHWVFSALAGFSWLVGWPYGAQAEAFSLGTLLAFGVGAGFLGVRHAARHFPVVATFPEAVARPPSSTEDALLCERLQRLFEEEAVHLDPELTLEVLSLRATAEPRDVSRVLNSVLGGGYHDVVRRYRVERAKDLLVSHPPSPVLSVLHDAGFNSKSAFHRAFSEHVGMTPGAWRRAHEKGRPTS